MSTSPLPIAQSPQNHWVAYGQLLHPGKTQQVSVCLENDPLTWYQVIQGWQQDADFRAFTTQILKDCAYTAFFWETPPLTPDSLHQPWEFVLVDAPLLAQVSPNPRPFATYLSKHHPSVKVFPNLGGDATLIAPCALAPLSTYTHLANFLRQAPAEQIDHLWQVLGKTLQAMVDNTRPRTAPLWVSTSGLGVYWLHIRLDDHPKYYTHGPYRSASMNPHFEGSQVPQDSSISSDLKDRMGGVWR